jgi:TorA maturation chaperone TorD
MSTPAAPLKFHAPVAEEEGARAGYYALLARLYYSGPDAALLASIAGADGLGGEGPSELAQAWNALAAAAGAADAEAAVLEYDEVFVGTGKAEVTPYATYYLAETGREKMLVRLKSDLAAMGLAKAGSAAEPEDHAAGLFEVMRHLISRGPEDAALQKMFFERYIAPFYPRFCSAVAASRKARFYKHVSRFAQAFFVVETEVLKMF